MSAVVAATPPADDGRSALVIVLLVLALLAAAVFVYQRSRASEPESTTAMAGPGETSEDGLPATPADPALADLVAETDVAETDAAEPAATEAERAPDAASGEVEPERAEDEPPRPDGA